jgi:hypothetical protein
MGLTFLHVGWFSVTVGLAASLPVLAQSPQFAPLPSEAIPAADRPEISPPEIGTVADEMGHFRVALPMDAKSHTHQTTIQGGTLTWTVATARQDNTLYGIAYADLPLDELALGYENVIESLRDRPFVDDFNWQAIANRGRRIYLDDFPGREFMYVSQGQVSAMRLYLVNRRVYVVLAAASELTTINQFLDSFAVESIWRPFVSEAGRFSVRVPMAPVVSTQPLDYRGDRLDWQQFTIYNLTAPGDTYQIAYVDLPAGALARGAETIFDDIGRLIAVPLEAEALVDLGVPITLQTFPGREYSLTTASGKSYILRFYLANERLYGVLSGSRAVNNHTQILDSFQIQP